VGWGWQRYRRRRIRRGLLAGTIPVPAAVRNRAELGEAVLPGDAVEFLTERMDSL
jgi:hypothetical protein